MSDKLKDTVFMKAVKLSSIDHKDPLKRSFFLMIDGKKTVSEIIDKLKTSEDIIVGIINEFVEKGFIKPLFSEKFDSLDLKDVGRETINSGLENFDPAKFVDEKLSGILKNYLGPLSVTAIKKDLASINDINLLKSKLVSYTKYILDETDRDEYLKEIEKYFKG